jgi:hypothetical protein
LLKDASYTPLICSEKLWKNLIFQKIAFGAPRRIQSFVGCVLRTTQQPEKCGVGMAHRLFLSGTGVSPVLAQAKACGYILLLSSPG